MKKMTEYQAIIVDVDGTLYYQKPVQLAMLKEMALHFWRLRDFLIVKKYRELFEQGFNERERLARLPENTSSIIHEWMVKRPCPYITKHKDEELIRRLTTAQRAGTLIIVYSDYPVKEKLSALGFSSDFAYCSEDIGALKPEADGLKKVLAENNIIPERCLVIGDREEKDGALAANLGADVIILPKTSSERERKQGGQTPRRSYAGSRGVPDRHRLLSWRMVGGLFDAWRAWWTWR